MDTESGLQVVKSLIGNVTEVDDGGDKDRIMEMDEIRAVFLEHGVDMDAADLEECSEREMEEALRELEQASGEENREVEEVTKVEDDKDMADGDVGKKNGSRKRLFKPTISTAASTKMRLAKVLVSPRKRAVVFSLVGFVYHQVRGSQENEGLQNSTLILWAGVRERACCFKKPGQQTTFGSSYGTNSWSQDEENMWSIVDIRGLLWLLGTIY
ncbi:unnamed protein product [Brassica rapa subsp. narinosa]